MYISATVLSIKWVWFWWKTTRNSSAMKLVREQEVRTGNPRSEVNNDHAKDFSLDWNERSRK